MICFLNISPETIPFSAPTVTVMVFLPLVTSTSNPSPPPSHRFIYVTYHSAFHSHLKPFAAPNCTQGKNQISQQGLLGAPHFFSLVSPFSQYTPCSSSTKRLVISLFLSVPLHMLNCLCLPWKEASFSLPHYLHLPIKPVYYLLCETFSHLLWPS